MFKKLLLLMTFLAFSVSVTNAGSRFSQAEIQKFSQLQYKVQLVGDAFVGVNVNGNVSSNKLTHVTPVSMRFTSTFSHEIWMDNFPGTVTFRPTGVTSVYDLQSNGVPMQVIQDPNTPLNVHATFMSAQDQTFSDRTMKYSYSSDGGATWSFLSNVPAAGATSGFGAVSVLGDGVAVICLHSSLGGAPVRTQFFVDAFTGLGSFTNFDPGVVGETFGKIWPRFVPIAGGSSADPGFVWVASVNGQDSTFWNRYSSSAFLGYQVLPADQAETYSLARGDDGRLGILYKTQDAVAYGGIEFIESTDNGVTWSTPIRVFNPIELGPDSVVAAIRGVSLAYQGNTPAGVFEICLQLTSGSFFPAALESEIRFWSPNLPGVDPNRTLPIAVLDTNPVVAPNGVPYAPNVGVNDVFTSLCRPTIGTSDDGEAIFVAMMVASDEIGGAVDSTSFRDVYMTASGDGGINWLQPVRITPETPRRDWTYPSLSPRSVSSGTEFFAHMSIQSDLIPGSFVNGNANGPSDAEQIFVTVQFDRTKISVQNISSEIPASFELKQNFPNPFNPATVIRFAITTPTEVTLKVYDVTGKEVANLINNQVVSAGINEVTFNAASLPSGLYFYTLQAGDFKETKKMMLVK